MNRILTLYKRLPPRSNLVKGRKYLSTLATTGLIVFGVPLGLYTYKCLMLIAFQNKLIYMGYLPPGSRHNQDFKQQIPSSLNVQEEFINTVDNIRLHGFQVTKKQTVSADITVRKKSDPILIYFQGNAGNMADRFELFKCILTAIPNLTIIGIAYRQYGNSEGYATEKGLQKDAQAILDSVLAKCDPSAAVYLYGHSLGGAVAVDLMKNLILHESKNNNKKKIDRIQGIIIENTFTSIYDMVNSLYPKYSPYPYIAKYCLWNHWCTDANLRYLPSTTRFLFLSSDNDEIVPSSHMRKLYSIARYHPLHNATLVRFKRSLHMDIYSKETKLFQTTLRDFIK
ncbi:Alpha/Beta hydrolase protein [Halteromyces radiatus]|uniref:Alpha/Beta hydrolase protein n=1 Tax=Halteromyces radiatus TaxID=101107 RepID=UPI00221E7EEE|nr:Alpha/Beta hydrolase protein [Halteromyces radiatus]KAI8099220.1 Alpha/Beta hydrolase protein [Halteromyces radiatus]